MKPFLGFAFLRLLERKSPNGGTWWFTMVEPVKNHKQKQIQVLGGIPNSQAKIHNKKMPTISETKNTSKTSFLLPPKNTFIMDFCRNRETFCEFLGYKVCSQPIDINGMMWVTSIEMPENQWVSLGYGPLPRTQLTKEGLFPFKTKVIWCDLGSGVTTFKPYM